MVQIKSIEHKIANLNKQVSEGVSIKNTPEELAILKQITAEIKQLQDKLTPLKNNLANSLAAKRDRENQQLLAQAGLQNVDVQDIIKQYIREQEASQNAVDLNNNQPYFNGDHQ